LWPIVNSWLGHDWDRNLADDRFLFVFVFIKDETADMTHLSSTSASASASQPSEAIGLFCSVYFCENPTICYSVSLSLINLTYMITG